MELSRLHPSAPHVVSLYRHGNLPRPGVAPLALGPGRLREGYIHQPTVGHLLEGDAMATLSPLVVSLFLLLLMVPGYCTGYNIPLCNLAEKKAGIDVGSPRYCPPVRSFLVFPFKC